MAVWVAAGLFVLLVVVVTLWRLDADALDSAEQDRDRAISNSVRLSLELAEAQSLLSQRPSDLQRAEATRDKMAAELKESASAVMGLKNELAAARKVNSDLSVENAQLANEAESQAGQILALKNRLRDNLNAKRPTPWKALVARLLQESGNA